MTVADLLINDCESTNWYFFFTDDEVEQEITDQQIEEIKAFLKANYDYSL